MDNSLRGFDTLLGAFINVARSSNAIHHAVECGDESWTYGALDAVSTALALDLYKNFGVKPIVAIVSENHPYVLANILAIWKLGGIVAPLDHNVPRDIMERMLLNIGPTAMMVPSSQVEVQKLAKGSLDPQLQSYSIIYSSLDLSIPCLPYDATGNTITALTNKYALHSPELLSHQYPLPAPNDIALYLHTSSASSVNNVKCVPLTHESILAGSQSRVDFWRRTWPQQQFQNLRILGWSPWSHVIGLTHDIGAAMFLSAGCYIFGIVPSSYGNTSSNVSRYMDVCGQLLETAIAKQATTFAGVPWVLEGFMRTYQEEQDIFRKQKIYSAIKSFKTFGSGGAATSPECIKWAREFGIPLVFDLGMTELGGKAFYVFVAFNPI